MGSNVSNIIQKNYQQVLLVFVAFLTMVMVSYFYVSNIVQKQMQVIGEETMNTTETAVSASIAESELVFSNMVQNMEVMLSAGMSNEEILYYLENSNNFFASARSPLPNFMKVYAYVREEFLDGSGWVPPKDYYPPGRPWHIGAVENEGEIFFSEPYVDADTGGMCISFSQQIFDNAGTALGIVALDLNLTRITDYISDQRIANNGYGVLLDDSLRFTSHRDTGLIGEKVSDAGGSYYKLAKMLISGEPISAVRFLDSDGTDSIAFFRTVFNGWHIGVVIPRASYYEQLYSLGTVLCILGIGLMLMLSYLLVRTKVQKMRADEESLSKSGFLARMSHEMRTPMNAIIGMSAIARKTDDVKVIGDCLEKINAAADHLLGVINDVLDMSKIEAGKLELSETDFPFQEVIDQVATVVEFKIKEKNQSFTVNVDPDVPKAIITDKQRLAQIITNLLSNSNKFTPEGGNISLLIRNKQSVGDDCVLEIEVADDGIGISKEQQERLFRSFEQADVSVSRKYGGTGLGLAISKRIIEMMEGEARIESELGEGAHFIFSVHVKIGKSDHIIPVSGGGSGRGCAEDYTNIFSGIRVLVAEDMDINREILAALLKETGITMDDAENGREVCEMFAADPNGYKMILMDVHMPEMDGLEATRSIREMDLPRAKSIPIIAMTANVFREDIEQCLAVGMNAHIGKPLDLNDVVRVIMQFIS